MTEIRALNQLGVDQFRDFLIKLRDDPSLWPPPDILEDTRFTQSLPGGAVVEQSVFGSKLEFGQYIVQAVEGRIPERILRTSTGLWAWLALFYIRQLCPASDNGRRKVLTSLEKYIASAGHISTNLDKHLLFFPWKMVALHGDAASWLLGGPLWQDTKVVRELANSYRRNVSKPFIELAKSLYFDEDKGRVRTGATTNKPGSLRRLDRVVSQLDLTYDVFGIQAAALAKLLPSTEFNRWLRHAS